MSFRRQEDAPPKFCMQCGFTKPVNGGMNVKTSNHRHRWMCADCAERRRERARQRAGLTKQTACLQ